MKATSRRLHRATCWVVDVPRDAARSTHPDAVTDDHAASPTCCAEPGSDRPRARSRRPAATTTSSPPCWTRRSTTAPRSPTRTTTTSTGHRVVAAPDADHARAAAREDGAVLARPLHVVGRQGERRHGGQPAQPVPAPRPRQLPRARPRHRARRRDAAVPRRRRQQRRRPEREPRPRADGALHDRPRPVHAGGRAGRGDGARRIHRRLGVRSGRIRRGGGEHVGRSPCSASPTRSTATGSSTCCATTRRAPPFIAGKVFKFFVGSARRPDRLAALAATFREHDLEIRPLVEAILTSEEFAASRLARPRFPVEWHVAAMTALGVEIVADDVWNLGELGQLPFYPPNVAGWPVGLQWVGAGRQLLRASMTLDRSWPDDYPSIDLGGDSPDERAEAALHHCGLFEVAPTTRTALVDRRPARPGRRRRRPPAGGAGARQPRSRVRLKEIPVPQHINRRDFLRLAGLGGGAAMLGALGPGSVVRALAGRCTPRRPAPLPVGGRPGRDRGRRVPRPRGDRDGGRQRRAVDGAADRRRRAPRAAPDRGPSGGRLPPTRRRHRAAPGARNGCNAGRSRVVDGVGSMAADLSHFEMLRRWWTGDPDGTLQPTTGFLGRLCDALDEGAPVTGLSVGGASSPALITERAGTLGLPPLWWLWWLDAEHDTWEGIFRDGLVDMGAADAADEMTPSRARHGLATGLRVGDLVGAMPRRRRRRERPRLSGDVARREPVAHRRRARRRARRPGRPRPVRRRLRHPRGAPRPARRTDAGPRRVTRRVPRPTSTPTGSPTGCSWRRRASSAAARRRPARAASTTARPRRCCSPARWTPCGSASRSTTAGSTTTATSRATVSFDRYQATLAEWLGVPARRRARRAPPSRSPAPGSATREMVHAPIHAGGGHSGRCVPFRPEHQGVSDGRRSIEAESEYAVSSYRYLRLGMVILVITLGVSIAIERAKASCWQGSISAYYYTPVHSLFVGALVSIGVTLVAMKGRNSLEDLFFNVAGVLAPLVALVPTSRPSVICSRPGDELTTEHDRPRQQQRAGARHRRRPHDRARGRAVAEVRPDATAPSRRSRRRRRSCSASASSLLVAGFIWYSRPRPTTSCSTPTA